MKLKINNPCKENWNKMPRDDQNRFCSKCKKTVFDLTPLSKEELSHFVFENPNSCGRLTQDQLKVNYPIYLPEITLEANKTNSKTFFYKPYIASFLFLTLLSCNDFEKKYSYNSLEKEIVVENKYNSVNVDKTIEDHEEMGEEESDFIIMGGYVHYENPVYPGGFDSLMAFVHQNFNYPLEAKQKSIQGKVFVSFTVDSNCNITNPKVVRSVHPLLDQEALKIVNLLPPFIEPARQKTVPVKTEYTLPFNFKLKDD